MRISILTPDLSNNCLGRAWLLAKVLERHYEIEIVGPMFGPSIWEPVKTEFSYRSVKGRSIPKFIPEMHKMLRKTRGDVVYASKPLFTSFNIGLIKKIVARRPLVLDIDDWEVPLSLWYHGRSTILHPNSYWSSLLNEKLIRFADDITVSNRFLQNKFGGKIIYHVRNTKRLDPGKYEGFSLKEGYGLTGKKVVTFLGTPRPHKGLDDLIKAVAMLKDKEMTLMIIGLDKSEYAQRVRMLMANLLSKEQVLDLGIQPIRDLPRFLSLTDVVVIPQRRTSVSIGQIPARVFDAMAMAKPIVATRVGELPELLDGCGWIVEPENPGQLVEAIIKVFGNFGQAQSLGKKAREKCIKRYSYEAAENTLLEIFNKYRTALN